MGPEPFRIIEYLPEQSIVLTAHEKYWRGTPCLGGGETRLMPGTKSRESGLKKADL
jgi:hypothetical protein